MKIRFDLNCFDIDTKQKRTTDYQGNELVTATLESILSLITSKYLYNEFETVEIHHTKFANITSDYRKYLNFLRDKNIILINESYEKGDHSKSYLFTDHFKEYVTVSRFKFDPKDDIMEDENPIYFDKMVRDRIMLDFTNVSVKSTSVEKQERFIKDGQIVVKFKTYLLDEYNLYRLRNTPRVLRWRSGRLYTPFVQLSKTVRGDFLYFDVQLKSLDIKRSFPLWLVVWLLGKNVPLDYETTEFISAVLSANIYYDLMEKFNNNRNLFNNTEFEKPFINKDQIKQHFGLWINGNNNLTTLSNFIFKTYYPTIFSFVKQFKNGQKDIMYKELVKLETDFIFNHVCKRLYNEIPEIQLLTCHDEIYFEEQYYEQVLTIWADELEQVYSGILAVNNKSEFDFDNSDLENLGIYLI